MSSYRRLVGELGARIEALQQSIEKQSAYLGERLARMSEPEIETTPIADPYRKAQALLGAAQEKRNLIRRIEDVISELAEVGGLLQDKQPAIAHQEREVRAQYVGVGQAVYRLYQNSQGELVAHSDLFGVLAQLEKEIEQIDKELEGLQAENHKTGYLGKAFAGARSVLVAGRLRAKQGQRRRASEAAGRKICQSDLLQKTADEALREVTSPVKALMEATEALRSEEKSLTDRKASLLAELVSLGAREGSQRRTRDLVHEVERLEVQLRDLYVSIGRLYLEYTLHDRITSTEIDECHTKISSLIGEKEDAEKRVARLNAAIEVNQIEERIADTQVRMERLRSDIRKINDEIESLQQQLGQMEEEKKRQVHIRGSEKSLLSDDTPRPAPTNEGIIA